MGKGFWSELVKAEANKVIVVGILGYWFIMGVTVCVCLCIILQERYPNSERYHHRELCRFAWLLERNGSRSLWSSARMG